MDWGNFDILVALSASYPGGRLTDIHWCSFDLRHKTIGFEASLLINDEGEDLSQAITNFNKFIYEQIILQNLNFCLICDSDELLCTILPQECTRVGIRLAPHFQKFFDIRREFQQAYPDSQQALSVGHMLVYLRIQEGNEKIPAFDLCKSIVRIVERMTQDGYIFREPQDAEQVKPIFYAQRSPSPMTPPPEPAEILLNLKVVGASPDTTEEEIEEFLFGIKVSKLSKEVAPSGRATGNFYVKCVGEEDALEALRYDRRVMRNRVITVQSVDDHIFDMNEENNSFMNLDGVFVEGDYKESLRYYIDGKIYSLISQETANQLELKIIDKNVINEKLSSKPIDKEAELTSEQYNRAVNLRGFPTNIKKQDILNFLKDFEVFKRDIWIKRWNTDREGSEATVLLNTSEERDRVLRTLSNKLYQGRFIEIYRPQKYY